LPSCCCKHLAAIAFLAALLLQTAARHALPARRFTCLLPIPAVALSVPQRWLAFTSDFSAYCVGATFMKRRGSYSFAGMGYTTAFPRQLYSLTSTCMLTMVLCLAKIGGLAKRYISDFLLFMFCVSFRCMFA